MTKTLADLKICQCNKPTFALCTPVAMDDHGKSLLLENSHCIGQCFCFNCGGVAKELPEVYDHITGGTVMCRLETLGIVGDSERAARRTAWLTARCLEIVNAYERGEDTVPLLRAACEAYEHVE
jgi:hypothetical protein